MAILWIGASDLPPAWGGVRGRNCHPQNGAFVTCTITFDLTRRFRMLGMRWKALDRATNLSQVPAQGDAAFQAFLLRCLRGQNARLDLPKDVIDLNRRRCL